MENPLNRLVILAKHGSMMLAGDCHFIQVPSQSSEMKLKFQVVNDVGARDADWVDWFIGVDKVQNRTGDWFFGVAALRNDVSWMQDQSSIAFHHCILSLKRPTISLVFICITLVYYMYHQTHSLLCNFILDSLLGLLFYRWEQLLCKSEASASGL